MCDLLAQWLERRVSYTEVMSSILIHITLVLCKSIADVNMKSYNIGAYRRESGGVSIIPSPSRHEGRLLTGASVGK